MKNVLVFVLLPLMAFAQPQQSNGEAFFEIELSLNLNADVLAMESPEMLDGILEIFVTVDVMVEEYIWGDEAPLHSTPKYLTSLHLFNMEKITDAECPSREAFRSLLVANDLANPKQSTFSKVLGPVISRPFGDTGALNNFDGFGPRLNF